MDPWMEHGDAVLWAQVVGRKPILPPGIQSELRLRDWGNGVICPLPLRPGLDRKVHVSTLSAICERLMRAEGGENG